MDFCSALLKFPARPRLGSNETLSNGDRAIATIMFIWLLPSKRDRKSGRKEGSKQAKGASSLATGERIIRKTFQLQYIKNTNLKNMLKGLSVGKTFTTTVRQVTPFYDWQTSFPHSVVRANAAAPEPKAVTEGKEGGGRERERRHGGLSQLQACVCN